jgi:hypothetical protein
MDDTDLQRLLEIADTPAPLPEEGLAARVRAKDRRRHQRQRRDRHGAAVLFLALMAVITFAVVQKKVLRSTNAPGPQASLPDQGELAARIHSNQRVLQALLRAERRHTLEKRAADLGADPIFDLQADRDRDRAAAAVFHNAVDLCRRAGRNPQAANEYRKVMELFPDSPLASAARAGLETLKLPN